DDPGFLFTKGPSSNELVFKVYGLESHAGVAPEDGISAIKIAAEAISAMRLGRIDEETTANIGIIEGGKATNIIPNYVYLKGEAHGSRCENYGFGWRLRCQRLQSQRHRVRQPRHRHARYPHRQRMARRERHVRRCRDDFGNHETERRAESEESGEWRVNKI